MIERLLRRHQGQRRGRRIAEWASRRREDQPRNLLAAAGAEALVGAVVLAIDGYKQRLMRSNGFHHQLAA
jgi:hypothetical protein